MRLRQLLNRPSLVLLHFDVNAIIVIISVALGNCLVHIHGAELTLDDLGNRLRKIAKFYPGQAVIVRADKETSYDSLVKVIDVCRGAGVWNFSLATANEETK